LKDTQQHKRAEKVLTLKDKGIATVIVLGASLDQYERYARKVNSNDIDVIQHIKDMIENPQARDLYIQSSMKRVLENSDCYFEGGMIKKHLTPLERQKLELNFQKEYLDSVGPMVNLDSVAALTNPVNLKEYMNRFDINKYYLKGLLNSWKEKINLILKQLDAMN
jgi:hypothetical protein